MLEEIIKNIPLNILVISKEGIIEYANIPYNSFFPREVCGFNIEKIISSEYVARDIEKWVIYSCETKQGVKLDVKLKDESFNYKKYRVYISPMNEKLTVTTWVNIDEFCTHKDSEILKRKEKIEESLNAKIEAINMLSHEIRTPLTSILTMAEFLCLKVKDSCLSESIEIIKTAAERLKSFLLNISDFTYDSFTYPITQCGFSLHTIAEHIKQRHDIDAKRCNTTINIICKLKEGTLLKGNEIYLWRIINTILTSILRHIKNGKINININSLISEKKKMVVNFEIEVVGEGDFRNYLSKIKESSSFSVDNYVNTLSYGDITYSFSLLNILLSELEGRIELFKGEPFKIVLEFPFDIVEFFDKEERREKNGY